jgi:hypothetical protein
MKTTQEKMVDLFKVEELQERMEFGDWDVSAKTETSTTTGETTVTAEASTTINW